jgi:hypothetical protein
VLEEVHSDSAESHRGWLVLDWPSPMKRRFVTLLQSFLGSGERGLCVAPDEHARVLPLRKGFACVAGVPADDLRVCK